MSNRFVRSSKYRHVFGTPAKKENCYDSIRVTKKPTESLICSVNGKFMAVVLESQGGGAFLVCPLSRVGRFDINYPKINGHKNPVLDIAFNPFNGNEIASCSEDATVKLWEVPDGGIQNDLGADDAKKTADGKDSMCGHQRKVTLISWHPSAENVLMSVGADPNIVIWNTKTMKEIFKIDCAYFPDVIHSVSWNYNGSLIATTCKDKKIRVLDPRKQDNPIVSEGQGHMGTKPSQVIFCGTSNRLFTTGFTRQSERQYGLWNYSDFSKPLAMENIDTGSGVNFPFWDEATKVVYLVGKGDTQIKYFEVTDQAPYVHFLSMYQAKAPQRSAAAIPKRELAYMKCEVMKFFRVLPGSSSSGSVEPLSMTVPRKSELFQDDIYPPCRAGKPAMTAEEWASGVDKDPFLLKFTRDGLVEMSEAECQIFTPNQKKAAKGESSVLKRLGSPQPGDASARPTPVSLAEYKAAYQDLLAENKKLLAKVAELEGKK